jgi:hypothetical protein
VYHPWHFLGQLHLHASAVRVGSSISARITIYPAFTAFTAYTTLSSAATDSPITTIATTAHAGWPVHILLGSAQLVCGKWRMQKPWTAPREYSQYEREWLGSDCM